MPPSSVAPSIGLVVEGPGDVEAVPLLLRRHLASKEKYSISLGKPICCNGRDRALVEKGVEGYIAAAAARPGCRGVLVVLDAENDPACELGPSLLERSEKACQSLVAVCLAERNFEDWIYASAEKLELEGLEYRPERSGLGRIKGALSEKYVKPRWQPRLTNRMDIDLARSRSPSLDRMIRKFDWLCVALNM
jgi:hypothetical protein